MRAVILAAGMGTRLAKYTHELPKGMLRFRDKPLLAWQIEAFERAGIKDIMIVTGYQREKIQFEKAQYFHNADYATTNMIESLMCMQEVLTQDDLIVAYSDIVFSQALLQKVMNTNSDVVVAADADWRPYWLKRYGTTETDLESLSVGTDHNIIELGQSLSQSEGIQYRYVGLNKFSKRALKAIVELYTAKKQSNDVWHPSGKPFLQGYFTDLINELIQKGTTAQVAVTHRDWLEFDTDNDYEMVQDLDAQQRLGELITL